MPDYYKKVDVDNIETFYREKIITGKDYRELRVKPNKIFETLQQNFIKQFDPFKTHTTKNVEAVGFLHTPPDHILRVFNKHYLLLRKNFGYYELFMISPTPTITNNACPVIIPITQTDTKKYTHAHFIRINGRKLDLLMFGGDIHQSFIHATHIDTLEYDDIFQITPPSITTGDVYEMMQDHFGIGGAPLNTILLSIFSSPVYEGRAGGNALSLITSPTLKYGCPQEIMTHTNKDLHRILFPCFKQKTNTKRNNQPSYIQQSFIKTHDTATAIKYNFNTPTNISADFLRKRKTPAETIQEINISTQPTTLNTTFFSSPVKEIVYTPTKEMQVLKYTDIPLLLTHHEINVNPQEKEIYTYASDIQHLIHNSRIHVPRTQTNRKMCEKAVNHTLHQLEKDWPQIVQLIQQGIIFDTGLIGGIGEHITRLTHAIIRANKQNTVKTATRKAENLYYDILIRICAEIETPTRQLAGRLEKESYEKGMERTSRMETAVRSVLFNLDGLYPEGWTLKMFVEEMKKRTGAGKSRINKYFEEIKQLNWIREVTPGLYNSVSGIDMAFT